MPRTLHAREAALRAVESSPDILQSELAKRLEDEAGIASSTAIRLLQQLERDGLIEGCTVARRKAYRPAGPEATRRVAPREERGLTPAFPVDAGAPPRRSRLRKTLWRTALAAVVAAVAIGVYFLFTLGAGDGDHHPRAHRGAVAELAREAKADDAARKARAHRRARSRRGARRHRPTVLAAAKRMNVAVLSGVGIRMIATNTGWFLKGHGFHVGTVANAPGPSGRSYVLYVGGAKRAARALARVMHIRSVAPADPGSRGVAPKARLIVLLGQDRQG